VWHSLVDFHVNFTLLEAIKTNFILFLTLLRWDQTDETDSTNVGVASGKFEGMAKLVKKKTPKPFALHRDSYPRLADSVSSMQV
jgi:hypothetical protein